MLEIMKHRAPDGRKAVTDGNFTVGMGRLAIIDLESLNLFPYQENDLTLTFNGEIYNFFELRKELESLGFKFKTHSDTEVLLKGFSVWGKYCFDKLNGMFAFAVYDGRYIHLARDIAGEKPLYYAEKPFRFASEAKALNFNCLEFPPASYGIWDTKNDEWAKPIHKWWNFTPSFKDIRDPDKELEMLLSSSIRLRTRSDVPYGIYLSDGIDSNLISTFHPFRHKFTYRGNSDKFKNNFLRNLKNIVWHLDYPVKSFSSFALWTLAYRARQKGVKVVLSGEGADELFGGYIRYLPDALCEQAQKKFPSYKTMFPYKKGLNEWCWEEFNGNLRELLRMGDRMASAWGVENRCPYLDRRIIEFAFSLTPEQKLDGFTTKVPLRKILKRMKPDYEDVEKKGLFVNVNKWIDSKAGFGKDDYLALQNDIFKKHVSKS